MAAIHRYLGFLVVGIFSVGSLLGIALWVSRRAAGDWFWRWLVAAQVVAIVQAFVGIALVVLGRDVTTWLHYVYGFGPLVVFAIAHLLAREEAVRSRPWAPFALASFISFGLSLRALTTGLGIG